MRAARKIFLKDAIKMGNKCRDVNLPVVKQIGTFILGTILLKMSENYGEQDTHCRC